MPVALALTWQIHLYVVLAVLTVPPCVVADIGHLKRRITNPAAGYDELVLIGPVAIGPVLGFPLVGATKLVAVFGGAEETYRVGLVTHSEESAPEALRVEVA